VPHALPVQLSSSKQFPQPFRAWEELVTPQTHSDVEKPFLAKGRLGGGCGEVADEVGTHLTALGVEESQMGTPRACAAPVEMLEAGQQRASRRAPQKFDLAMSIIAPDEQPAGFLREAPEVALILVAGQGVLKNELGSSMNRPSVAGATEPSTACTKAW
jgi:hypothetical protein